MRFWDAVRRAFGVPVRHTFDAAPRPIDDMFLEMRGRGTSVTREQALGVPAVLKARNRICSLATLPLVEYGPDNAVQNNALLAQIDPNVANIVTLAETLEDLIFDSIAWWRVLARGSDRFPMSAERVAPERVSLERPMGAAALPSGYLPTYGPVLWVDGEPVLARDMIRFDSPNPPLRTAGARAIRKAIKYDEAALTYANNPSPLDYFTPAENAEPIDDDAAVEHISSWRSARRRGGTGWIPRSMKYVREAAPTASDMQLVELQQHCTLEIANATGLDAETLGVSTTSRTYTNRQDYRLDIINDVYSPFMGAIAGRLSMGDVTRRGYRVEFSLKAYMRANPTERWTVAGIAIDKGVMSPEEIRAEEGLTPGAPRPAAPAAAPAAGGDELAARRAAGVRFDGEPRTFTADVPVHRFSVDEATRTIAGLAMPYGAVASKYGIKFRFAPGSLEWSDVKRVKMLRDHDFTRPIGVATKLTNSDDALDSSFRIGRGADADEALQLAVDEVLDGLSVGVDFDLDPAVGDVTEADEDGVITVNRATLREITLTALPAFDDARVTRVAASREAGTMHTCSTCGAQFAAGASHTCTPPAAAPVQLALPPGYILVPAPAGPNGPTGPALAVPAPAGPEGPTFVDPTRGATLVREPEPYRMLRLVRQGKLEERVIRGSHEFSTDVFDALPVQLGGKADAAAHDRVLEFTRAQFDVATTDVNELNPTRQRPEMYVDQRDFQYPLWSAIEKGTLGDVTPFTFPKFSSAAGMVAAHTEGVEPTSGTYVTTSQTVTPTPVSGKMKITRETIDQGGNPQVTNLMWRQMTKAWFEALEAFAVTTLDAASPTQIDFSGSPGLSDGDLDEALTEALVLLQFVRGGFTMDAAFTQVDLFKALVGARDDAGRPLYPAIGAQNANGTVRGRWAGVDVNGVGFLPAWALAATGTVAASSYLFDREVVHGWASAPQRLDFTQIEVAHVYIGLWGYKAAAISDIAGVREIVYDPS